jgi:hypothetical protein
MGKRSRARRRPACYVCARVGVYLRTGRRSVAAVRVGVCREPYVMAVCERHLVWLQKMLPASGVWVVERYLSPVESGGERQLLLDSERKSRQARK